MFFLPTVAFKTKHDLNYHLEDMVCAN